jgi:hypothetical protein
VDIAPGDTTSVSSETSRCSDGVIPDLREPYNSSGGARYVADLASGVSSSSASGIEACVRGETDRCMLFAG